MKNHKLNKANFCANRYYYDKGDLVYATFYADKLIDMLLIKEGGSRGAYNGIRKPQNEVVVKRKYKNEYRSTKRGENFFLDYR